MSYASNNFMEFAPANAGVRDRLGSAAHARR